MSIFKVTLQSAFNNYKWIFFCASGPILFNLTCTFAAHHGRSLCSSSFGKVSIDHLFDNLEYEKRNDCFGKSLEYGFKNLTVWTLLLLRQHKHMSTFIIIIAVFKKMTNSSFLTWQWIIELLTINLYTNHNKL